MVDRFWQKVNKLGPSDCWEWLGYRDKKGYGRFGVNGCSRLAHRVSFLLHTGDEAKGLLICHSCDNPSCVNPAHLFKGTNKDNILDSLHKGRQAQAVLKVDQINKIRELSAQGVRQLDIGKLFGVNRSIISRIKTGVLWNSVEV